MTRTKPLLIIFVALLLGVGYLYTVTTGCLSGHLVCEPTANPLATDAPFRYRVVAPAIQWTLTPTPNPTQALAIDAIVHAVWVALLLPALYSWLKRWMSSDRAIIGVLIVALVFMLSFGYYWPFGTTIIEMVLLVWTLNFIHRFRVVVLLLIVATLNRETALLIPFVYVAFFPDQWRRAGFLVTLYAVITLALHVILGPAPHIFGLQYTFELNIEKLPQALMYNAPFLPLWILVISRYRAAPTVLKRLAWIALVYGIAVLGGAMWAEIRVLLPLFPLLLPAILKD